MLIMLMKKKYSVQAEVEQKYSESRFSPYLIVLNIDKYDLIDSVEKQTNKFLKKKSDSNKGAHIPRSDKKNYP